MQISNTINTGADNVGAALRTFVVERVDVWRHIITDVLTVLTLTNIRRSSGSRNFFQLHCEKFFVTNIFYSLILNNKV